MRSFGCVAVAVVAMVPLAGRAGDACTAEARRRLPSREELAGLCPKEPLFATEPKAVADPRGGCSLTFKGAGGGMIQVAAARQLAQAPGGPRASAEKAAAALGKLGGGKAPAVKRMPWKTVEAYALEKTPGYFVDSGGQVLVVHVNAVAAKPASDDCVEAVVRDVARRFAAR